MIRLAIIGTGFGRRVLLPAFSGEGFDVVANCSRDWRSVLQTAALDAVAIAVPPMEQPEIAEAMLDRGIAVFCEKPLAMSAARAQALAARAAGGPANMIDFEFPEIPAWRRAIEIVSSGDMGRLRHVDVRWSIGSRPAAPGFPNWKQQRAGGGGALQSFAPHTLHVLERVGGPIATITARIDRMRNDEADTLVSMLIAFRAGALATVTIATNDARSAHRVEITGDAGTLTLASEERDYIRGFRLFETQAGRHAEQVEVEPLADEHDDGRIAAIRPLIRRFRKWILTGAPQRPSFEDGARVQLLIDAAIRSADTQTTVAIPDQNES